MTNPAFAPTGTIDVRIHPSRAEMGRAAAALVATEMRARLAGGAGLRMIFAAAPSQAEMLEALVAEPGIDWGRVTAFHMDEYIGLAEGAPERFALWLRRHLFDRVPFAAVHAINPGRDPAAAARAYAAALDAAPIDIVCLGIGVNGHLAFNDPPVANLADPEDVKIVELDATCRQQQVDDGCFAGFDDVPTHAITLTVPRLLRADRLVCVVPGAAKRDAVRRALQDPIGAACPATALRQHPRVVLFLDAEANPDG
ncbi:glucosamine-6-phosphate deaminase [Inquilinus ginsengisoli]|uniref:Glucosamine-6-phosphate deaminase n=1 Tax=Inquilinus ginsengisoli TaxID=363840 RepID=A0ABU1JQV7_9PROT|nr:6-phosphogluconolactonase [Inquilinus ginsengisoli]MDR6290697.1 glucosamine-6-phosphate deaminase [Inquilinus ginsengisoli]